MQEDIEKELDEIDKQLASSLWKAETELEKKLAGAARLQSALIRKLLKDRITPYE